MALIDVRERIRKKKRKKRKRILLFLTVVILIGLSIAMLTSPWLDIKKVVFVGNEEIPLAFLEGEGEKLKGENLLLLSKNDVISFMEKKAYYSSMKMTKKFPSTLKIEIIEKKAEINYLSQGVIHLLTRDGFLLESGANMVPEGLFLLDDEELPELGKNIYEDNEIKRKLLEEFRELQIRNNSEIHFTEIDLKDMANIKTYYEDLEIWLGYPEALKEKLNAAINIITEGKIQHVKGYVDVSYMEKPVFYDESALSPVEAIETPVETTEDSDEAVLTPADLN